MHDLDIAGAFFGGDGDGANTGSGTGLPFGNATMQYAEAVSGSSNGYVTLQIDGVNVSVHTTYAVDRGDTCIVSVSRREPVVIGVVGKGDAVDNLIAGTINATVAVIGRIVAGTVSADKVSAAQGSFAKLTAEDFASENIEATTARIVSLVAQDAEFDSMAATKAAIKTLEATKAYIDYLEAGEITAEKLTAGWAYVDELHANYASVDELHAALARIKSLDADFANIDFANVDVANIGELFAKSGIIQDIVTESGTVTGRLVGVTIVGDLIEAGTLKADSLVVKGEDGLYYKLNVDAESVEGEQTDYNSINGKCIQAQSITATKISVSDLVAFGATIGGLVIEDGSLHSFAKDAHDSGVNGFFLGADGSAGLGGASSYVRYDAEADSLDIKARSVSIDSTPVAKRDEALGDVQVQYALSSSETAPPSDGWSATAPARQPGKYVWQRTVATKADWSTSVSAATCISGADGNPGADGKTSYLHIAYATNATGTSGFSTTDSAGKTHIGTYTDFAVADSTDPKKYAWTKIKGETGDKGDKGEKGKGVSGVDVKYYLSTSATALIGGEWTTDAPAWVNGRYMWSKTVTTYSDGSSDESAPVNITGAKGPSGATGIGVKAIVEQYYLSTSSSAQAGGSWTDACPAWATGKYLWTRSSVTWTDSTVTYTDPVLAGAINSANQNAANAAKTATNYMEYTSAGLDVGNKSSGKWAGFRTRMTSGAFQVLNAAGTVLASYGDKAVELGRNAADAVIKFCGGKGTVSYGTQGGTLLDAAEELTVGAARVALRGVGRAVLQSHCKDYDSGGHSASTAYVRTAASAGASPSPSVTVRVAKNDNVGADGSTTSASTVASNLTVTPTGATFDKPFKASSLTVGTCPLTGDATWLYAPGVAATKFCTNRSSAYPVYGAKIVYSNVSAGTSGTVTINETSANFQYLEIFFRTNDGERNSTRVYQPNGKIVNLTSARVTAAAGSGWIKSKQIQVSGTSLAYVGYAGESGMGSNAGGTNYVGGTLIYLVVGYK